MADMRPVGQPMTDFETLFRAIAAHATRAAEKLRRHGLVAGTLTAFFHTNWHSHDRPQYGGSRSTRLMPMSQDTFELVEAALRYAEAAWPGGRSRGGPREAAYLFTFTKAGMMLDDLVSLEDQPRTLFDVPRLGSAALMGALDAVNGRFGKNTLVMASEGTRRPWQLRADHCSPRYTTRIADLPVVR